MSNVNGDWIASELTALNTVKEKLEAAHYRLEMGGPRTIINITDRDHVLLHRAVEHYERTLKEEQSNV